MNTVRGIHQLVHYGLVFIVLLGLNGVFYSVSVDRAFGAADLLGHQSALFIEDSPSTICDQVTQISTTECSALVAFYNATNGAYWTNNADWLATNTPCSWFGVACVPGISPELMTVRGLEMPGNNLNGYLPPELAQLTNLYILYLDQNELNGSIPTQLGSLLSLRELLLNSNQLIGTIPTELGNLTNLLELHIGGNLLSGSIPASLGNLTNLQNMSFWGNQLSGPIPAELGGTLEVPGLLSLESLDLSRNILDGQIPDSLGNLSNLRSLNLFGNQFTGNIPSTLEKLDLLETLNLGRNPFTGPIPPELGNMNSLRELYLGSDTIDGITGSIPPELGKLANLEVLDLFASYGLTGIIPSELGNLSNLRILNLCEVAFVGGQIPSSLGKLTNLEQLNLCEMELQGSIPSELSSLNKLVLLDLSRNNLSGQIPSFIGELTNLEALDLYGNQLEGPIPDEIGSLINLERLCLHGNKLSGEIPASITNLDKLNTSDPRWWNCNYSDEPNTTLNYNSLYTNNPAVISFLEAKAPLWQNTQTVPPTNLYVSAVYMDSVDLKWDPILYTQDGGYYEVSVANSPTGTYTLAGATPNKDTASINVGSLTPGNQYYFRLRTFTPAHNNEGQQNDLWSDYTDPIGFTFDAVQPENSTTLTVTDESNTVAEVNISPGAVSEPVTLSFTSFEELPEAANFSFASMTFDLSAYQNGTLLPGYSFEEPVVVSITYTDQDIAGLVESTLYLYYWDQTSASWVDAATTCTPPSSYTRSPEINLLEVPICHLSLYGLFSVEMNRLYLPLVGN